MEEAGFAVAFFGGMAAIFSPCAALLLPSFFAFAFSRVGTLLSKLGVFFIGLLITMVPLGALAGSLGQFLHSLLLIQIVGGLLIVLGLAQALGLGFALSANKSTRDPSTTLGVFFLGVGYGLSSGCTGPILGSVLAIGALGANTIYSSILLAVFCCGMVCPLLILTLLWSRLKLANKKWLRPHPVKLGRISTTVGQLVTGILFAGLGILLLTSQMTNLFGLDAEAQIRLESQISVWATRIGNPIALVIIAVLVGLVVWAWLDERDRLQVLQEEADETPTSQSVN